MCQNSIALQLLPQQVGAIDFFFDDGAMYKHGNSAQGIFVDPGRDFAAVYFSATPYVKPYGETKLPAYFRKIAKNLAGE